MVFMLQYFMVRQIHTVFSPFRHQSGNQFFFYLHETVAEHSPPPPHMSQLAHTE